MVGLGLGLGLGLVRLSLSTSPTLHLPPLTAYLTTTLLLPYYYLTTTLPHTCVPHLFQLCNDASLERHAATNLPLKAMATQYVANLKVASAAALGKM